MINVNRYIKFLIVGAIGTAPNFIVFNMLNGWNNNVAWACGIIVGATSNYILNEYWTWKK